MTVKAELIGSEGTAPSERQAVESVFLNTAGSALPPITGGNRNCARPRAACRYLGERRYHAARERGRDNLERMSRMDTPPTGRRV
jgi:hypothetical protein